MSTQSYAMDERVGVAESVANSHSATSSTRNRSVERALERRMRGILVCIEEGNPTW